MPIFAITSLHYLFSVPLALISVFLILVVLEQRGRGGGLTGALGGMGGQSAFGTKAGDLFTRITIVVAAVWILLSMGALTVLRQSAQTGGLKANAKSGPVVPGAVIPGSTSGSSLTPATKDGDKTVPDATDKAAAPIITPPATTAPEKTAPATTKPADAKTSGKTTEK